MQGFFGKIPIHGDFVTRNLPRDFIDGWDEWLQRAIAESKSELGDAWLDTYLTSPIWRFVLVPGVCGEKGWAGILMPSVDRVGRYFPLTIASSLHEDVQPFQMVQEADDWFSAAESLALSVLNEDSVNADALATSVSTLDDTVLQTQADSVPGLKGGEWGMRLTGATTDNISSAVSHELVRFQVGPYSLWWAPGSDELMSMGMVTPDLPNPLCFARLLEGTWGDAPASEALETKTPASEMPASEMPVSESPVSETLESEPSVRDLLESETPENEAPVHDTPGLVTSESETPEGESPVRDLLESETLESETPEGETPERDALELETPVSETPESGSSVRDLLESETPESETPVSHMLESETPESESSVRDLLESETRETEPPKSDTLELETPESESPVRDLLESETPENETPVRDILESETPESETPVRETQEPKPAEDQV